jgi:amidohydrolase
MNYKKSICYAFVTTQILLLGFALNTTTVAQSDAEAFSWNHYIDEQADALFDKVVQWRRHFHQYPELSNREFETATKIEAHLRSLGMEVQTGIAHTGVVGILEGGLPGPVVALRADTDALPVEERTDLPFASRAMGEYMGQEVPVMHACGHDTHIAILMGVAEMLASVRHELPGTVKFIFQPAEEGAPPGEEGGAELMVREGVLKNPDVDVIFGLHIIAQTEVGTIEYRPGPLLAAVDVFRIEVRGKQTHGSTPWTGIDPIVTSAQIINSLQTVVSRNAELTKEGAVVSVGIMKGGVRSNIIPESAEMTGTIRTLDAEMRERVHADITRIATHTAAAMGAEVVVEIETGYPITYNHRELTALMEPTFHDVAGEGRVRVVNAITGAEDFSFFQQEVPGLFFFIGGMPSGMSPDETAPHHTPDFFVDEEGMRLGIRAMARLTLDYMQLHQ